MHEPAFDTVIVPDFRDPARVGRFEPQALMFLASWIEHAGPARHWPVHVACIGEPPRSIRMLGEQCGARITVHESKEDQLGRFGNKLCAWDIDAQTAQLLYLDADMLCLQPPIGLAAFAGSAGGSPAGLPRVPEAYWKAIDQRLGLPAPTQRMACTFAAAGIPLTGRRYGSENAFAGAMWPLFNGGLLFVPFDVPLPQRWVEHWNAIGAMWGRDDPMWVDVVLSDMTALATALRQLQRDGLELVTLPSAFNTRWMQVVGGTARIDDCSLFHAVNLFRQPAENPHAAARGIRDYISQLGSKTRQWAWRVGVRTGRVDRAVAMIGRPRRAQARLAHELQNLFDTHVGPAMKAGR